MSHNLKLLPPKNNLLLIQTKIPKTFSRAPPPPPPAPLNSIYLRAPLPTTHKRSHIEKEVTLFPRC
jgi:hypothetical protein